MPRRLTGPVIPSEAKQSIAPQKEWIASSLALLAMTVKATLQRMKKEA